MRMLKSVVTLVLLGVVFMVATSQAAEDTSSSWETADFDDGEDVLFEDPVPGAYNELEAKADGIRLQRQEEESLKQKNSELGHVEAIADAAKILDKAKDESSEDTTLLDTTEEAEDSQHAAPESANPDALGDSAVDPTTASANPDDDDEKAASPIGTASASTLLGVRGGFSPQAWSKVWEQRAASRAHAAAKKETQATPVPTPVLEREPITAAPLKNPEFPNTPLDGITASKLAESLRPPKPPKTSDLVPLLRFYSPILKDTVTTIDPHELHGDSRFIFQGVVCFVYSSAAIAGGDVVPLYRFRDSSVDDPFTEYLSVQPTGKRSSDIREGIAGFIFKERQTGLVPLNEYFSSTNEDHLYSLSEAQSLVKNGAAYSLVGTIGWVHRLRDPADGNNYGGRVGGDLDKAPEAPTPAPTVQALPTPADAAATVPPEPTPIDTSNIEAKRDCLPNETPEKNNCKMPGSHNPVPEGMSQVAPLATQTPPQQATAVAGDRSQVSTTDAGVTVAHVPTDLNIHDAAASTTAQNAPLSAPQQSHDSLNSVTAPVAESNPSAHSTVATTSTTSHTAATSSDSQHTAAASGAQPLLNAEPVAAVHNTADVASHSAPVASNAEPVAAVHNTADVASHSAPVTSSASDVATAPAGHSADVNVPQSIVAPAPGVTTAYSDVSASASAGIHHPSLSDVMHAAATSPTNHVTHKSHLDVAPSKYQEHVDPHIPHAVLEAAQAAAHTHGPVNPIPPVPAQDVYNPWIQARASGTPSTTLPFGIPPLVDQPPVNMDAVAASQLVPHPNDPDLVPVYRYWNPKMQDHYYTLDFTNLGNGKDGWQYQGIQCYIYKHQKDGAIPLYRYWNLRLADHYYTTDYNELKEGKDGYKYKGILGYVLKTKAEGTVPLYEYFNADAGDHFYTDNFDFLKHGASGWKFVRVSCYVYPHPSGSHSSESAQEALEKDGQVELPLLVPLYRYWNIHMRDHFYTTLWKEVEVGTHGWEYQGVQALVYATQAPGTVAFHRYWNLHTLDHFYTTNFTLLAEGGQNGWVYEGIQCYVSPFRSLNSIPLYGYYNEQFRDHFYTTKHLGNQIHGWVLEGIQAYVWDTPLKNCSKPPPPSTVRFDPLNNARQNYLTGLHPSVGLQAVPPTAAGLDPRVRGPWAAFAGWPLYQNGVNPLGQYGQAVPFNLGNNNQVWPAVSPGAPVAINPTLGSLAPSASVIGPSSSFLPVDVSDLSRVQGRVNDPLSGAPTAVGQPTFVPVTPPPVPDTRNLAQAGVPHPDPARRNPNIAPANNIYDTTSFLEVSNKASAKVSAKASSAATAKTSNVNNVPVRLPEDSRLLPGFRAGTGEFLMPPLDPRTVPIASTSLLEPSMKPPVITDIRTNPSTMPDLAVRNPWHPRDTFLRPRNSKGLFKPKLVVPNQRELVPLYRYWNGLRKDHFYTTKTFSMKNWEFQGLVGYLYKFHKKGTVPLFRYFNRKLYDHFYTTKYRKGGDGDYKYQGIVGFVRVKAQKGMVPLYQYYNALFADHFYTGSWKHLGQGKAGWQYEGTQGYIFPPLRVHKLLPFNAGSPDQWMGGITPVPLYAYYNARARDHFYSTSGAWAERYDKFGKPVRKSRKSLFKRRKGSKKSKKGLKKARRAPKYRLLGIAGLIYLRQAPNTVPLHRYYNSRVKDHFYTTNWMTLGKGGKGGWRYEGIQGYVFPKHAVGTIPLYRYYSSKARDHMYTTKFAGMVNKQGFKLQGIACYVRQFNGKMLNVPSWLAGIRRQPLYRYFNRRTNDHFYTTRLSLLGKDTSGRNGWIYQGITAYLPIDATPTTQALYVYFNTFSNDHFYTRNFNLLKRGGKFGWKYQGIEGLVYKSHEQGTVPLHRYYNRKVKDHYYTTDWSILGKAGRNGWVYQGIEGYVFPPRSA